MADSEKRTFSLPSKQASYIDALVASGSYASASEVVRDGLRSLQERDAFVAQWLRKEVGPAYDAITANPKLGIPAEKVFADLHAHHLKRVKQEKENEED